MAGMVSCMTVGNDCHMFSVAELLAETMGRRGQLGLCTFGNP